MRQRSTTLRERKKQARYSRVLDVTEELLSFKGFDQLTTKEIANAAEIGEATLFRYFGTKTELLLHVVGRSQEKLLLEISENDARIAAAAPPHAGPDWFFDRIRQIYEARIAFYRNNPENVPLFIISGLQADNSMRSRSTLAGDWVIELVRSILVDGVSSNALQSSIDPLTVARNVNGVYIHEVLRTGSRGLDIDTTWERLKTRIDSILVPLALLR